MKKKLESTLSVIASTLLVLAALFVIYNQIHAFHLHNELDDRNEELKKKIEQM